MKIKEIVKAKLKGCGNVALQVGYNVTYCGERILCKECISNLLGMQTIIKESLGFLESLSISQFRAGSRDYERVEERIIDLKDSLKLIKEAK